MTVGCRFSSASTRLALPAVHRFVGRVAVEGQRQPLLLHLAVDHPGHHQISAGEAEIVANFGQEGNFRQRIAGNRWIGLEQLDARRLIDHRGHRGGGGTCSTCPLTSLSR